MNSDYGVVHVDIDRLDILLNLVGELVINRARQVELGQKARAKYGFKEEVLDLVETTEQVGRISEEIQTRIINARLVPISNLFDRFKNLVNQLSENGDKKIGLTIKGETTEIDKRIIDDLAEPLVHLVRNALDHGIESIAERKKSGKPVTGNILLNAFHEGNQLVVEVIDDGQGIDPEAVRKTAVEKGFYSAEEAQALDQNQLTALLFKSGFTTNARVTGMSGRGVGMDVVARKLEELGGSIGLSSEKGKGCTARIKLPMTMAIIQALVVQVAEETYAIPLEHVSEMIRAKSDEISTVENHEVIDLRGNALSLLRLSEVLDVPNYSQPQWLNIVVVSCDGKQIGLILDRVVGRSQIVIKSMGHGLSSVEGVSGASISGDGNVVMILDVPLLCEKAINQTSE
jgi:two-component system, chemotaxis family, sensor kinase CheA